MKTILALIAAAALVSCAGTPTPGGTAGVKAYTKDTCAVTDNKLGSMGPVITKVHEGQQVKFCCQPCVAKFEKNPQRYLAAL